MIVIIKGQKYDSEKQPILVKLSEKDKKNFLEMLLDTKASVYMAHGEAYKPTPDTFQDLKLLYETEEQEQIVNIEIGTKDE